MKVTLLVALALVSAIAMATPDQMQAFREVLQLKESSHLYKAECSVCHVKPPVHNPFGKELKAVLSASKKDLITLEMIKSLDQRDSDGDGWPDGEEIQQDFLPGDPNSHPAGMPPGQKDHKKMMGANMDNPSGGQRSLFDQVVPKHSFHPMFVHFPIALFMFGAGMDLVGWRRKNQSMRQVGWLGIFAGAVTTLIAVPSGLMAFLRNGFEWQGTSLIHVIFAVLATLLMTGTVLWRRKAAHESYAYFALLLLAAIAVGLAGHFGGQLVFRD